MKNTIFILMLIAATLAVRQSSAQARPSVVKSPIIRASAPLKSLGIINHHISPPPPPRLGPAKVMSMGTTPTSIVNTNGDGTITSTTTTTNNDGSTTTTSTTTNPDGSNPQTTTTTTPPATTTSYETRAIKKNYSDEQLPPPQTTYPSLREILITYFEWIASGL